MPTTTNLRPGRLAKALPAQPALDVRPVGAPSATRCQRPGCRVVTPSPLAVTTARGSMTEQPRLSLLGRRVEMASQRIAPRPKIDDPRRAAVEAVHDLDHEWRSEHDKRPFPIRHARCRSTTYQEPTRMRGWGFDVLEILGIFTAWGMTI